MTTPEFREILDDYLSSSLELLEKAEDSLLSVESAESALSVEGLAELKRVFHTLKGNSAMMGFDAVAHAAHEMEDALASCGAGDAAAEEEVVSLLLVAIGRISTAFRAGEVPGVSQIVVNVERHPSTVAHSIHSDKSLSLLDRLQGLQAVAKLDRSFVPPRDSGIT